MPHPEDEPQCPYEAALVRVNANIEEHTANFKVLKDSLLALLRKPKSTEADHTVLAVHAEMLFAREHIQAANVVKLQIKGAKIVENQMKEHLKDEIIKAGPGARTLTHTSTRKSVLATLAGQLGRARAERVLSRVERWVRQQGLRLRYQA